jgi:hypothetical protein
MSEGNYIRHESAVSSILIHRIQQNKNDNILKLWYRQYFNDYRQGLDQ